MAQSKKEKSNASHIHLSYGAYLNPKEPESVSWALIRIRKNRIRYTDSDPGTVLNTVYKKLQVLQPLLRIRDDFIPDPGSG
jgi:hypothetical protein